MEVPSREEIVEELRERWRKLWRERVDDKVKAEGIANSDFPRLLVDRGTVIFATRDFKPLSFREILELNDLVDVDRFLPNPYVGGWGKFTRTMIAGQKSKERIVETRRYLDSKKKRQHLRKGGRGWLHF